MHFAFLNPAGGLRTTYGVHLGFSWKKCVVVFLQTKCNFQPERNGCFELFNPHWNLETMYGVHHGLIGKGVRCKLPITIVLNVFFARYTRYEWIGLSFQNQRFHSNGDRLTLNFRYKGSSHHHSSPETRLNDLLYGIKICTDFSSVLSQFTRLTDIRTDRQNFHQ